jgi:lipoyl-dependent peroxiredoxin subunit C
VESYFFWPKDFTFVSPTGISAFAKLNGELKDRDAQLLGGSTDSEFVHMELTQQLGVLDAKEGMAQRATFVVDPDDIIRLAYVTDLSVGRNPQEVLHVLDALQTDELCPCNWKKGEETLRR